MSTLEDKQTELLVTIDELKQQALDIGKQIEAEKEKHHEWKVGDCVQLNDVAMVCCRNASYFYFQYPTGSSSWSRYGSIKDMMDTYPSAKLSTFEEWCNGRS